MQSLVTGVLDAGLFSLFMLYLPFRALRGLWRLFNKPTHRL